MGRPYESPLAVCRGGFETRPYIIVAPSRMLQATGRHEDSVGARHCLALFQHAAAEGGRPMGRPYESPLAGCRGGFETRPDIIVAPLPACRKRQGATRTP